MLLNLPFDLHVLGLPLAFILSQDQTLHCNNPYGRSPDSHQVTNPVILVYQITPVKPTTQSLFVLNSYFEFIFRIEIYSVRVNLPIYTSHSDQCNRVRYQSIYSKNVLASTRISNHLSIPTSTNRGRKPLTVFKPFNFSLRQSF